MNKKAQIGLIEVGAETLPKWLLYPLIILICLTFVCVIFFFGVVGYSCLKGDCNGYYGMGWFGYHYYPFIATSTSTAQSCYVNHIQVNCSEFPGDEHFCNNGICNMNGVCPSNMSVENCIKQMEKGD